MSSRYLVSRLYLRIYASKVTHNYYLGVDPYDILEPEQVYFRSTEPWLNDSGHHCDVVVGDVLLTRHPCKVNI